MVSDKAIAIGECLYADGATVYSLGPCHAVEQAVLRQHTLYLGYVPEKPRRGLG
jgi:hypothetical protein